MGLARQIWPFNGGSAVEVPIQLRKYDLATCYKQ